MDYEKYIKLGAWILFVLGLIILALVLPLLATGIIFAIIGAIILAILYID